MSYTQIIFNENPNEVGPFLEHLDATPAEDRHIVAGQYDGGDEDYGLGVGVEDVPLYPGDLHDRHGAYVVIRNEALGYFSVWRDNDA